MKKTLVLAVALAVGLAFAANAAETKTTTKVTGDTTKTTVKGPDGKAVETIVDKPDATTTSLKLKGKQGEAKETVVEKKDSIVTKTEIKGKDLKMDRSVTETADKVVGSAKIDVKNGAIKELNVNWTYYKTADNNYVMEYTIKEHDDKQMAKELGLTPEQAADIATGMHKIISTSPYTAADARDNFRALIAKDLKESIAKKKK